MNRKGMDDFISREKVKEAAWEGFINRLVEDQGMYGYKIYDGYIKEPPKEE